MLFSFLSIFLFLDVCELQTNFCVNYKPIIREEMAKWEAELAKTNAAAASPPEAAAAVAALAASAAINVAVPAKIMRKVSEPASRHGRQAEV